MKKNVDCSLQDKVQIQTAKSRYILEATAVLATIDNLVTNWFKYTVLTTEF